ncbi:MAG: UDP-3-O-(3-hydroxymyristoyl)glucosamine N-acyltransferase [Deltaproteobacteria bacterium]|nr:UDP-3-O-(3-hydroxymyristoyl)glucosamine N-acyltransferase [Deltaproteobacteria bacterium]
MPAKKTLTLLEIGRLTAGRVSGDAQTVIADVAAIDSAGPGQITFLADRANAKLLKSTKASAVIVKGGEYADAAGMNLVLVKNPQIAFAAMLEVFRPGYIPLPGVHPLASVHAGARLGQGVSIQAFAVVEEGASIGQGAALFPGVYVGKDAEIGADAVIYSNVSVREGCKVGDRVIIHCNSVIGSDGFGYAWEDGRYFKLPQRGIARVEDDVELGACVTVDRAALGETVIGRGSKIDNLVQIAHNVHVGENSIIVAQAGIAGSTRVGCRVQIGGQVGIVGHITIGDNVMIGAKSGVSADLPSGGVFSGIPAIPHGDWLRAQSIYAKLPELKKKISELEKRLKALEEKPAGKDG